MLNDFEVVVKKEETDMVDSLRYSFQKLLTSAVSQEIEFQRFFSIDLQVVINSILIY